MKKSVQYQKRSYKNGNDSSSDDDDDDNLIERRGSAVYFYTDVSVRSILKLSRLLDEAANESLRTCNDPMDAKIILYIQSSGGDAYAGMSGLDDVLNCKVPVWTVATGWVASAATFILLGGARRFATPHSTILVHELSTGFCGKYKELVDEMQNSKSLMELITEVYRARTNLTKKRLAKMLNNETTFQFNDAVAQGFVEGELPITRSKQKEERQRKKARAKTEDQATQNDTTSSHLRWQ